MTFSAQINASRRLTPEVRLPAGFSLDAVLVGDAGQEVLAVNADNAPTASELRRIHRERQGQRGVVLAVAAVNAKGTWIQGPSNEGLPVGPLADGQAARVLEAFLGERMALASRQRLVGLLEAATRTDGLVGALNSGLFATHYLERLPSERADWPERVEASQSLVALRGTDLVRGLGYRSEGLGAGALLLTVDEDPPHAVAVLVDDTEGFEAVSTRFGASPIQHGLAKAAQARVPWLMVLRGSQIRLYPVRPEVGVGRRSQAETFFEMDLAVVDAQTVGFLSTVFAAGSLVDDGSVDILLAESKRFAASLGERLRDRVYNHVVPDLAVAVAAEMDRLGRGEDLETAYRVTLKILFRLLFQAYAEDQGLLPYGRNDRYTRNSLTTQADDFVERPERMLDPESHAIWDDLQQVWDVINGGNRDWDVPAYNGGLFASDADRHPDGALISEMRLHDLAVGSALRHLLCDETEESGLAVVDFRSLSVREFGTIYEGLLESSLSRADQDLTVDPRGSYLPAGPDDEVVVSAGSVYHHNASGERKSTGSYFTKPFIVEHLLERALDPALDRHLEAVRVLLAENDEASAAERFFDFRVADLAMGSGHFLVAAVDRLEAKMAAFLTEHPIPRVVEELNRLEQAAREALGPSAEFHTFESAALLRRQIAKRCIYGVDINEIAVELARVAIWIHTFVPGLPMSSLDHTLVCANSLTGIGTIEEALDALEPGRGMGKYSIYADQIDAALTSARDLLRDVANSSEATRAEVRDAYKAYQEARRAAGSASLLFDAAVGLRSELAPDLLDSLQEGDLAPDLRLEPLKAGHFPVLFPEVFNRPDPGFDVLVGNPPWEQLQVKGLNWWVVRFPGLKGLTNVERERQLERIVVSRPDLVRALDDEIARVDATRLVVESGPYPGLRAGHLDLYQVFAWRNWQLVKDGGAIGVVLPRSAFAAAGTTAWRQAVLDGGSFGELLFLTNTAGWVFDQIDVRYTVSLAVVEKSTNSPVAFAGPFHSLEEFVEGRSRPIVVSKDEFVTWSDTFSFPRLTRQQSGEILRTMKSHPSLASTDGWEFRPVQGDLNATSDRSLFDTDLERGDLDLDILTGASFEIWDPYFGEPYGRADGDAMAAHLLAKAKLSARRASSAFSGLRIDGIEDHPISQARIAFRDVTNPTNQRTAIFCLLPPWVALVNKAPYLLRRQGDESDEAYLLGMVCSIPFDWYARRWVELNMNFFILNPMPVPRPDRSNPYRKQVVELAGRLAAVDEGYQVWADAVGVPVGGLIGEARDEAIAELDALAAHLYGLSWEDVQHVFETFHRGWNYADRLSRVKVHYDAWEGRG